MIKKLLITVSAVMIMTASAVSAEEGYIFKLKDDVVVPFSLTDGVEVLSAEDAVYKADSLEDVYKFADSSSIENIGKDARVYLLDDGNDTPFEIPNDPGYKRYQWNFPQINMNAVWKKGCRGEGATVCIIDSGLNIGHEDLDESNVISAYNVFDDTEDITDHIGHGTFVTGIIAAKTNNKMDLAGIADKSKIVSIKAFDNGKATNTSTLIKALDEVYNTDEIDVLNMSLGTDTDKQIEEATLDMFEEAINKVIDKGVIVIAAVGNDGSEGLSYPAAFENVIGVGAVAENKHKCDFSQFNESVFVVAPGGKEITIEEADTEEESREIVGLSGSTSDGLMAGHGTSFAAPHVAGVAAIAKSIYPDLNTAQFKEILKNTSEDLGDSGYDTYYGYGLIDADKVITEVEKLAPEKTPMPSASPSPTPIAEPTPTPTPGFVLNPDDYRELTYVKESGKAVIETDDREAVVYAVKFDGAALKSIEMIKIKDLPSNDEGSYEILLSEAPTKLFLWHGMIGCKKWVNED